MRRFFIILTLIGALAALHANAEPVRKPLEIVDKTNPNAIPEPPAEPVDPGKPIRIGLRVGAEEASVSCEAAIAVEDLNTKKKETWPAGKYVFTARGNTLYANGKKKGTKLRLSSKETTHAMQSNTKDYRGDLIAFAPGESKVNIIEELSIDDYLKGVLPREVVVTWHEESLRVQAVASRTYLASHLGRHSKDGFDLCADVHCQAYGGMSREHPKTNEAVDATQGEILTYDGIPLGAFFHSNCGGSTEKIKPVWDTPNKEYLPRKKCGYGTADPRYNWTFTLHDQEILDKLKKAGKVQGSKLESFKVKSKSESGRASFVTVKTDEGSYDMLANTFRIACNPEKIRSTLWTDVSRKSGAYVFEGRGWGHGVGMCQWGAKGQAEQGRSYRDILVFYYPHSKLTVWRRK